MEVDPEAHGGAAALQRPPTSGDPPTKIVESENTSAAFEGETPGDKHQEGPNDEALPNAATSANDESTKNDMNSPGVENAAPTSSGGLNDHPPEAAVDAGEEESTSEPSKWLAGDASSQEAAVRTAGSAGLDEQSASPHDDDPPASQSDGLTAGPLGGDSVQAAPQPTTGSGPPPLPPAAAPVATLAADASERPLSSRPASASGRDNGSAAAVVDAPPASTVVAGRPPSGQSLSHSNSTGPPLARTGSSKQLAHMHTGSNRPLTPIPSAAAAAAAQRPSSSSSSSSSVSVKSAGSSKESAPSAAPSTPLRRAPTPSQQREEQHVAASASPSANGAVGPDAAASTAASSDDGGAFRGGGNTAAIPPRVPTPTHARDSSSRSSSRGDGSASASRTPSPQSALISSLRVATPPPLPEGPPPAVGRGASNTPHAAQSSASQADAAELSSAGDQAAELTPHRVPSTREILLSRGSLRSRENVGSISRHGEDDNRQVQQQERDKDNGGPAQPSAPVAVSTAPTDAVNGSRSSSDLLRGFRSTSSRMSQRSADGNGGGIVTSLAASGVSGSGTLPTLVRTPSNLSFRPPTPPGASHSHVMHTGSGHLSPSGGHAMSRSSRASVEANAAAIAAPAVSLLPAEDHDAGDEEEHDEGEAVTAVEALDVDNTQASSVEGQEEGNVLAEVKAESSHQHSPSHEVPYLAPTAAVSTASSDAALNSSFARLDACRLLFSRWLRLHLTTLRGAFEEALDERNYQHQQEQHVERRLSVVDAARVLTAAATAGGWPSMADIPALQPAALVHLTSLPQPDSAGAGITWQQLLSLLQHAESESASVGGEGGGDTMGCGVGGSAGQPSLVSQGSLPSPAGGRYSSTDRQHQLQQSRASYDADYDGHLQLLQQQRMNPPEETRGALALADAIRRRMSVASYGTSSGSQLQHHHQQYGSSPGYGYAGGVSTSRHYHHGGTSAAGATVARRRSSIGSLASSLHSTAAVPPLGSPYTASSIGGEGGDGGGEHEEAYGYEEEFLPRRRASISDQQQWAGATAAYRRRSVDYDQQNQHHQVPPKPLQLQHNYLYQPHQGNYQHQQGRRDSPEGQRSPSGGLNVGGGFANITTTSPSPAQPQGYRRYSDGGTAGVSGPPALNSRPLPLAQRASPQGRTSLPSTAAAASASASKSMLAARQRVALSATNGTGVNGDAAAAAAAASSLSGSSASAPLSQVASADGAADASSSSSSSGRSLEAVLRRYSRGLRTLFSHYAFQTKKVRAKLGSFCLLAKHCARSDSLTNLLFNHCYLITPPPSHCLLVQVGRDPSFDALANRGPSLNRAEFGRAVRDLGLVGPLLDKGVVEHIARGLVTGHGSILLDEAGFIEGLCRCCVAGLC